MDKIKQFLLRPVFQKGSLLISLWLGVAFLGGFLKFNNGAFNNFKIFRGVFHHTVEQLPLYAQYPAEYGDSNFYGVVFSALIAPFAVMPDWAGIISWVVFNSLILYIAIKMLPLERWQFAIIIWFAAHELFNAVVMQQFNVGIAALIVLSFVAIERKREEWAACAIMLGLMTKIYGVVGLAFLPFSKNRVRFVGWLIIWGVLFFVLPMLYSSYDFVVEQYRDWFTTLVGKNDYNMFSPYQNISLLGLVRKISGDPTYSDLWLILGGLILFAVPYLRFKQYPNQNFRLMILSSMLLFTVLFSTGSESSGYITAIVGVGIWFVATPSRNKELNLALLLFVFIFTSLSESDIIPRYVKQHFYLPYALKALPCVILWLKVCYELMFLDFENEHKCKKLVAKHFDSVDVVLPCYNPHADWVDILIDAHARFSSLLESRKLRFIVVNDGSVRGYDQVSVERLQAELPETIIIDLKVNQGKGVAIRSGVERSDADCILYTDIDFPYEISSMREVVERLELGYDIVIATRNKTYYRELTLHRKILSKSSKLLNMMVLGLGHNDTQGGLKGIDQLGKQYLMRTRVKRFLFDTEFIYLASKHEHVTINEMPANLRENVILPNMRRSVIFEEMFNFIRVSLRR